MGEGHYSRPVKSAVGMFCVLGLVASIGWAQDGKDPKAETDPSGGPYSSKKPKREFSWREQAEKRFALSDAVVRLEKDKLVFVDEDLKQPFSAYVHTDLPFFITSDAVLHAYHVLLEESLARLEFANAVYLRQTLRASFDRLADVVGKLEGDEVLKGKAYKRAAFTLAVPLRILGEDISTGDAAIDREIAAEVARIRKGQGMELPRWLGLPSDELVAVDYASFVPAGFYLKSELLGNYFRTTKWLQVIPFRSQVDEEWVALWLISEAMFPALRADIDWDRKLEMSERLKRVKGVFGLSEDWGIYQITYWVGELDVGQVRTVQKVKDLRGSLPKHVAINESHEPLVNDLLRIKPFLGKEKRGTWIRMLPGIRLSDSVLFQFTVGTEEFPDRKFPTGLQVAAWLGGETARSKMEKAGEAQVLKKGQELEDFVTKDASVYGTWMSCMRTLIGGVDSEAPNVFKGEAWKRKTCETVLTSWAQMRHSAVLQAKRNVSYMGFADAPSGFIEPNPDFFSSLATLVNQTEGVFETGGVFEADKIIQAIELRELAGILKTGAQNMKLMEKATVEALGSDSGKIDPKNDRHYVGYGDRIRLYEAEELLIGLMEWNDDWHDLAAPERIRKIAAALEKVAEEIETGKRSPLDDGFARKLRRRWHDLESLSRRLEALCHKQLRGVVFSREEDSFLKGIGNRLGRLEFYDGNSWLAPRDDAPKVSEIFHNPTVGKRLHVAVGRPMAIYILYPWKGKERLCRGAVMSYYEFLSPNPLTDLDWKKKLDSDKLPSRPDWTVPVEERLPGGADPK